MNRHAFTPGLRRKSLQLAGALLLAGAAFPPGTLTATTSDKDLPLVINVRSTVDRPFEGMRKAKVKEHGKVYAIVSIEETKGEEKLLAPLDENGLLKVLRAELTKRGFKETGPGLKPEILLTVNYGRGWLRNPYQNDASVNDMTNPPVVTIQGAFPTQLLRQKEFGFEEKLQNANFEKLFIRVSAWEFPDQSKGKVKPKELWKTTIVTDSPEYRDLNQFYAKMLAAGSGFFDQEIDKEEAEIRDDMPEGKVILGEMKVLKEGDADIPLTKDDKQPEKKSGK